MQDRGGRNERAGHENVSKVSTQEGGNARFIEFIKGVKESEKEVEKYKE